MQLIDEKGWTLGSGLTLIRALQPEAQKFGYHLTLGGGVLNKGRSTKDLDLYFLPMDNVKKYPNEPDKLVAWLVSLWGEGEKLGKKKVGSAHAGDGTIIEYYNSATDQLTLTPPAMVDVAAGPANTWWYRSHGTDTRFEQVSRQQNGFTQNTLEFVNGSTTTFATFEDYEPTTEKSQYKHKLKFKFGEERIDVFVL